MSASQKLEQHQTRLGEDDIVLRPMTEDDWDLLLTWNNDPEVLYHCVGGYISAVT